MDPEYRVPQTSPTEFRDDVVGVARHRELGATIEQIAKDFGVHPITLQKWRRDHDLSPILTAVRSGRKRPVAKELGSGGVAAPRVRP
ncbi:helix-turn-helix domain-containing protein [Zhihengliuella halotolerans]|uniref:helix-turn-helix domain-containing protein n=1 Tax=Zhihengliuella halotolerans TaxID=370736 RepID=UPI0011AF9FE6